MQGNYYLRTNLCAHKYVQTLHNNVSSRSVKSLFTYLDEGVIEDEHDCSEPPCPFLVPEKHLSKIAYITHFRVTHTKLPGNQTGVKDQSSHDNCKNKSRHKPKN